LIPEDFTFSITIPDAYIGMHCVILRINRNFNKLKRQMILKTYNNIKLANLTILKG